MLPSRKDEFDLFKRQINLTEFAASQGYLIDRKESSRCSVVMRGPADDKLVITINRSNGHWIYFSVRDHKDNGTILDFAQNRLQCSFGEVRKLLRPWIGESRNPPRRPPKQAYVETVQPVTKDLARVIAEYSGMYSIDGHHAYLEEERKIPAWVLSDPRFADKIKIDRHRNAIFPHYNASGMCGYELKNRHFTGFAKGGEKGMWASAITAQDTTLIIVEAAIDALSYHAIHRPENARYISMGGSLNPEQPVLIRAAIQRLPEGANLIIATDNDEGGDILAEDIRRCAVEANRPDISAIEDRPEARGDDWNDVLRQDKPFTLKHSYRTALSHTPNAQRYSG